MRNYWLDILPLRKMCNTGQIFCHIYIYIQLYNILYIYTIILYIYIQLYFVYIYTIILYIYTII